jgi:hypothetical protein
MRALSIKFFYITIRYSEVSRFNYLPEDSMSKHDTATKRHTRPKSKKRVDYTARTMATLKKLKEAEKAS